VTFCSDRTAAAAERQTTVSYLAVYFGLRDQSRPGFHNDHIQWLKSVTTRCRPPPNLGQAGGDQPALSVECVRRLYTQRRDLYRKQLSGIALEESHLSPALLKSIQKRLVELKFLSGTADGIFGADTRAAIRRYQESIGHVQSNFLNAEERSMLLGPNAVPEQNASFKQTSISAPEPSPEIASTPPATVQILQNTDDGPHEPNATGRTEDAPAQQSVQNAANGPTNASTARVVGGGELQTHYLIGGALLVVAILSLTAVAAFIRWRRRIKIVTHNVDPGRARDGSLIADAPTTLPTGDRRVSAFRFPEAASRGRKDASGATVTFRPNAQAAQVESSLALEPLSELLARYIRSHKAAADRS
jgi:hypothetical protein